VTLADRSSRAGTVITSLAAAAGVALGASLVWGLRSLIVPGAVGGLVAYIVRPLVARLERFRSREAWRSGCSCSGSAWPRSSS